MFLPPLNGLLWKLLLRGQLISQRRCRIISGPFVKLWGKVFCSPSWSFALFLLIAADHICKACGTFLALRPRGSENSSLVGQVGGQRPLGRGRRGRRGCPRERSVFTGTWCCGGEGETRSEFYWTQTTASQCSGDWEGQLTAGTPACHCPTDRRG